MIYIVKWILTLFILILCTTILFPIVLLTWNWNEWDTVLTKISTALSDYLN